MYQTLSAFITLLHKDFLAFTDRQLRGLGLGMGSLPFILYLGKHPLCSPSELTAALRMDWGHSQRTLTRLEDGGFLTREKSGRSYRLSLTESGQQAFTVCHQVFLDWDQNLLGGLSPEEGQQLLALMAKAVQNREDARHV